MGLKEIWDEYENRRGYLQALCNKFGDFKVATTFPDKTWSRHVSVLEAWQNREYWRLDRATHRQIFPNELVLDIDHDVKNTLTFSLKYLEKLGLSGYEVFATGSKGYHVHLLFGKELTREEKIMFLYISGADPLKSSSNVMIALEFAPHWKSGKVKEVLKCLS
jgi:hypothetical protein